MCLRAAAAASTCARWRECGVASTTAWIAGSASTSSYDVPIMSPPAARSRARSGSSVTPRAKRINPEPCAAWMRRLPHQPSPMIAALSMRSNRRGRARLLERMSAREGVDLLAGGGDANHVWEGHGVDVEEFRPGGLAREADVGDRHLVAMAETSRLLAFEMGFERGERLDVPMAAPCHPGGLVDLELMLEIFAHPRHDQRMRIAGDDLGEPAGAGAAARIARQQRGLRVGLVEIFDDRQRLEQDRSVAIEQRRKRHHGIDRAVVGLALLPLHQVHVDDLVGRHALEVERDADPIGRERAPERIELHGSVSSATGAITPWRRRDRL